MSIFKCHCGNTWDSGNPRNLFDICKKCQRFIYLDGTDITEFEKTHNKEYWELIDLAKAARDKGETFDAAGFIEKVLNTPPPPPPPPVTCPKCGSTQIQLVNRKWGLFTGILTNAVDRVCVNCKHKF